VPTASCGGPVVDTVDWLAVVLIAAPILPLTAAFLLLRHWPERSTALHERAILAIRDWVVASLAAILAMARLDFFTLPNGTALVLIAVAMLLVSIPSAYWVFLYATGRFR
jgi:hypothetical protein